MKLIYTILLYFIQPIIWIYLLFRSLRFPPYRGRWAERYGFCKNKVKPEGILLHSVSVGETFAAISLIRALLHRFPSLPITITTMTPTGSERVISIFGKEVCHVYLPYDLPCAMRRFLNTVRPKLVIIMETELWPNMIFHLYQRNIPLVIANARLSDRAAKRYSKLGKFTYCMFSKITLIIAQNEEDAARFFSLGIKQKQISVTGNLKFDSYLTPELINRATLLRRKWTKHRKIWIATSTHNGEESIIIRSHRTLLKTFPNLLLILVPRHPERFKDAQNLVRKSGLNFTLYSSGVIPSESTQVVIGDTMGDLMLLYGLADLAFVGGSLVKKGGHNPLEPAAYAIPILMGPHTFNFKNICTKLQQANGLITVIDTESIVKEVSNLLTNEEYNLFYGRHAIEVLQKNQGSSLQIINLLEPYLSLRSN